ncbi:MAG TPA: SIMPL domain-containing protein [Pyrinomonadaceae bacterium]|nr:SIMPL domain-containing protein [Pyrinomonadaceae bacterium]
MRKSFRSVRACVIALVLMSAAQGARAQTGGAVTGGARGGELTRVVVTGDALVQSQPDTAVIQIGVVTQNASASEAQAENASKSEAVVRAVKAAAGPGAEVKTSGYSLQPQYDYRDASAPRLTGYLARNSVLVTMGELQKVGAVIDAAARAGANNIDSLSFTLRRDEQARGQALTNATREALSKARLLAEALGGRLVRVVEVQEAGAARPPVPLYDRTAEVSVARGAAAQTPIEIGTLDIRAQVQLVAEIEIKQ